MGTRGCGEAECGCEGTTVSGEDTATAPTDACPGNYVEWRVTGEHTDPDFQKWVPPYDFVWSPVRTPHLCTSSDEAAAKAREFAERAAARGSLTGVTLSRRTIRVTAWTAADTFPGRDEVIDLEAGVAETGRWMISDGPVQTYLGPVLLQRYTEAGELAGPVETGQATVHINVAPIEDPEVSGT